MQPPTLDYAARREFDAGLFVARYFQALAWLSIASTVVGLIVFDSLRIDLSPIFLFWAASVLKRHSRTARMWVLTLGGIVLGVVVLIVVWAAVFGTGGMHVSFGFGRIKNPALWQVVLVAIPIGVVVGIPFAVLMSQRARRQFRGGADAPRDET